MKNGDLVKIRQEYYDEFGFDIENDNIIYTIENMKSEFATINNLILICNLEKKTYYYIQKRYLITISEIRKEKIKRLIKNTT